MTATWTPSAAEPVWAPRGFGWAVGSSQMMADSDLALGLTSTWVGCLNPLVLWRNPSESPFGVADIAATLGLTANGWDKIHTELRKQKTRVLPDPPSGPVFSLSSTLRHRSRKQPAQSLQFAKRVKSSAHVRWESLRLLRLEWGVKGVLLAFQLEGPRNICPFWQQLSWRGGYLFLSPHPPKKSTQVHKNYVLPCEASIRNCCVTG